MSTNCAAECGIASRCSSTSDQQRETIEKERPMPLLSMAQRSVDMSDECGSVASSSCSNDSKLGAELDTHLMQTIKESKFVTRQAKFSIFGGANFQRECLEGHNVTRQAHGCPSLVWAQGLASLAEEWAAKIVDKGRILYPEQTGVGENISLFTASQSSHLPSGIEVTEMWTKEGEKFDFNKPRWRIDCQHFTQMIWKESREVGAARCWNKAKNLVAVVAFYRPAGNCNVPGEFALNVPPRMHSTTVSLNSQRGTPNAQTAPTAPSAQSAHNSAVRASHSNPKNTSTSSSPFVNNFKVKR